MRKAMQDKAKERLICLDFSNDWGGTKPEALLNFATVPLLEWNEKHRLHPATNNAIIFQR
jgi:hypothetical protein